MNIYILILILFLILILCVINKLIYNKESFYNYKNHYINKEIPKVIISTYHNKEKIPKKVFTNISKYAPNYKFVIFDDNQIIEFLKKYYSQNVLEAFYKLHRGAHKADLFRYCYLYKYGGIYIDIKTELIKNVDEIFNKKNTDLYTVLSKHNGTIYQGIIASVPNNPIFKDLIDYIVKINKPVTHYFSFTRDFYNKLQQYYKKKVLNKGYSKYNNNSVYLFYEVCTKNPIDCVGGLDRHNLCCFVYDNNNKIIKTRYPDYPW